MPHDNRVTKRMFMYKFMKVFSKYLVVEVVAMGRLAMVALVKQIHLVCFSKLSGYGKPVVGRAKKAVKDNERRPLP